MKLDITGYEQAPNQVHIVTVTATTGELTLTSVPLLTLTNTNHICNNATITSVAGANVSLTYMFNTTWNGTMIYSNFS